MQTELGKIKKVKFGMGGYQDVQVVFEFVLEGKGWGTTSTFEGGWSHITKEEANINPDAKWNHESRVKQIGEKAWQVIELMKDAKATSLTDLEGKPVRAYFSNEGRLLNFEILKEVL